MRVLRARAALLVVSLVISLFVHVHAFSPLGLSGFVSRGTKQHGGRLELRPRNLAPALNPGHRRSASGAGELKMMNANLLLNIAIGAVAGSIATAATFPIDAAKTRIQAHDPSKGKEKKGVIGTMAQIVKEEGFGGLFKGSLPVILGAAPETAIQLSMYDLVLTALRNAENLQQSMSSVPLHLQALAGGFAGLSTIVATNPLEVLKIRAQTHNSSLSLPAQIKELGFSGLFHGYQATWFRDVPFAAIYFPVYTNMKICAAPFCDTSFSSALLAGMVSGLTAGFITTPADVIMTTFHTGSGQSGEAAEPVTIAHRGGKATDVSGLNAATEPAALGEFVPLEESVSLERAVLKMDLAAQKSKKSTANPIRIGSEVYRTKGLEGLFNGVQGRLGKMAPAMAISLCVYDTLQRWLAAPIPLQTGPVVLAQASDISAPLTSGGGGGGGSSQMMAMVETVGSGEAVGQAMNAVSQVDMQMVQDAVQTACSNGLSEAIDAAATAASIVAACNL